MRALAQRRADGTMAQARLLAKKSGNPEKPKKSGNPEKSGRLLGARHPLLADRRETVSNDVFLRRSLVLTGPNASGKTTLLKAVLLNVLLTQQVGQGCYAPGSAVAPYDFLHCYLSVPETSGRDSLFQAEVRRCKAMADAIAAHPDASHLCVLDELFSGTNPAEAEVAAAGFMRHLCARPAVQVLLTTHFVKVARTLAKEGAVRAVRMRVDGGQPNGGQPDGGQPDGGQPDGGQPDGGGMRYTYRVEPGVSAARGGLHVLRQMQLPLVAHPA
jgi:DNA mismatch repair ATPase MutS